MQFLTPMPARFRQYKVAKYKIADGYITPDSCEVAEKVVDNEKLLFDYLELMGDYAQCAPMLLEQGAAYPLDDKEQAKYKTQYKKMADCLLDFCNKWGLFGLLFDRAYSIRTEVVDGEIAGFSGPVSWLVYKDPYDPLGGQARIIPNEEYMAGFRMPARSETTIDFYRQYSESITDILFDPRIRAAAQYVDDTMNARPAFMPTERVTILLESGAARPSAKSLNAYCQILFLIDEMKGPNRTYEICHHCGRPFLADSKGRIYCSDACMNNERNRQYRLRRKGR